MLGGLFLDRLRERWGGNRERGTGGGAEPLAAAELMLSGRAQIRTVDLLGVSETL